MKVKDISAATEWQPSRRYGLDRPRVSVLLPTCCRGQSGLFLRAARSVLGQSLAELELLIVDDASTDGTAQQIAELMAQDDRVSLLRHPRHVGLPALSEYEAFLKARAEYLAFAFDDDEFSRHALAELLAAIEAHDHSIVHGIVHMLSEDVVTRQRTKVCLGRPSYGQATLRGTNYIPNTAVMLHRRVLQTVGFYDPHVAMSRAWNWDLWRRVAECFPIAVVPVVVGWVQGPPTAESRDPGRLGEPWQSMEWAELPRNAQLKPGAIEEYDVLALPGGLSREAVCAVREIGETFRDKFWFPQRPPRPGGHAPHAARGRLADGGSLRNGHLLVVSPAQDASAALYFDHLPAPLRRRVRVVYPATHKPEEMIGASAVVFLRHLLEIPAWIDYAQCLSIPCYYFLDDNFTLLGSEGGQYSYLRGYTDDALRERLQGFAGVLLSSRRLIDYFREKDLHANLLHYPPIAKKPAWAEAPPAPPKRAGTTRIAFFGGSHRLPAFEEEVFPAITRLAEERPLELFAAGMPEGSLAAAAGLKTTYFPFEPSYDIALARLAACEIDLLVHPNSETGNNQYKTCNVLISAWAAGAVPVLSDAPPYDALAGRHVAILCGQGPAAWHEALRSGIENPQSCESLRRNLEAYCLRHYSGEANVAVIETLLDLHPAAGLALRDQRWRRAIELVRPRAPVAKPPSLPIRVACQAMQRVTDSLPARAVRRLWRMLSLRPQPKLQDLLAPAFRPFLATPPTADWLREGYRLRASRDLRRTPHLAYPLPAGLGRLSGLLLAPALSTPLAEGSIHVEIAAADGQVLAQDRAALGDIDPAVPTLFAFPPVATDAHQRLWLRVYGKELTAPVRILHWSKRGLRPGSRGRVRPFCAFRVESR
jgi:hypothetical protein